jgi:hypothetical protein
MDFLYIINPENFKGSVLSSMPLVEKDKINETFVHYSDNVTFAEYNKQHGGNLLALTWEEFDKDYYSNHLKNLCGKFKRTTKEDFWNALECLPPKRWTREKGKEFFFLGECYTANLYTCFVRKGNNYYSALRPITASKESLFSLK